jgi:tetratricopeptide (TPR) repeat protein
MKITEVPDFAFIETIHTSKLIAYFHAMLQGTEREQKVANFSLEGDYGSKYIEVVERLLSEASTDEQQRARKEKAAIACYTKLIEEIYQDFPSLLEIGAKLLLLNAPEKAEEAFDRIIQSLSGKANASSSSLDLLKDAQINHIIALVAKEKYEEAETDLERLSKMPITFEVDICTGDIILITPQSKVNFLKAVVAYKLGKSIQLQELWQSIADFEPDTDLGKEIKAMLASSFSQSSNGCSSQLFSECFEAYKSGDFSKVIQLFKLIPRNFEPDTDEEKMFKAICLYKMNDEADTTYQGNESVIRQVLKELDAIDYSKIYSETSIADSAFLAGLKYLAQYKYKESLASFSKALDAAKSSSLLISEQSRATNTILGQAISCGDFSLINKTFSLYPELDITDTKFGSSMLKHAIYSVNSSVLEELLDKLCQGIKRGDYQADALLKKEEGDDFTLLAHLLQTASLQHLQVLHNISERYPNILLRSPSDIALDILPPLPLDVAPDIRTAIFNLSCRLEKEPVQNSLIELGFDKDAITQALNEFYSPEENN